MIYSRTTIHSIMIFTGYKGQMLLFNFNSTQDEFPKWEKVLRESLQSISIREWRSEAVLDNVAGAPRQASTIREKSNGIWPSAVSASIAAEAEPAWAGRTSWTINGRERRFFWSNRSLWLAWNRLIHRDPLSRTSHSRRPKAAFTMQAGSATPDAARRGGDKPCLGANTGSDRSAPLLPRAALQIGRAHV